jgi:hypothetical protein
MLDEKKSSLDLNATLTENKYDSGNAVLSFMGGGKQFTTAKE